MTRKFFQSRLSLSIFILILFFIGIGLLFALYQGKLASTNVQPSPEENSILISPLVATERKLASGAGNINTISWHPNNKELVYSDIKKVTITDLEGNVPHSLDGRFPAWSPDGKYLTLVFPFGESEGNKGIVLFDARQNRTVRLTSRDIFAYTFSWEPDGAQLFFTGTESTSDSPSIPPQVWVVNRDSSGERKLTDDEFPKQSVRVSPDGSKILYSVSVQDTSSSYHNELWVMDADGSNQRYLGIENPLQAYWSHDGQHILVGEGTNILLLDSDGSNVKTLTRGKQPTWNSNSSKIAYASHEGDIWIMNADGSDKQQLTKGPAVDELPVWSPDGMKIAFSRAPDSKREFETELWFLEFRGN